MVLEAAGLSPQSQTRGLDRRRPQPRSMATQARQREVHPNARRIVALAGNTFESCPGTAWALANGDYPGGLHAC